MMISGLLGYAASFPLGNPLEIAIPILLVVGLYLVSSGSFAINQAQEWERDKSMNRTASRPIPAGTIVPWQAYLAGALMCFFGIFLLMLAEPRAGLLALLTVVLYNGLYTLYWKRRWTFGAVPGAIPGAMPVVIGYASNGGSLLTPDCVYLFLIMFLWQMPHFWSLAIRYKDDYERGGFPVPPNHLGVERTLYHIGLYMFAYVGVALSAPLFVSTQYLYFILIVPLSLKIMWEFWQYFKSKGQARWLPFFLWVNLSMLAFLAAPVFDRWIYFISMMKV